MLYRYLLLVLLLSVHASAQPISNCDPGTAGTALDVNNVRAWLNNTGRLFGKEQQRIYYVPKVDSVHANSWQSLWIGGQVNGELRTAVSDFYGPWEFWPGPLDAFGNPPTDCTPYDRLFKIDRRDLDRYHTTGEATPDLADWPWAQGAPVVDGDGVPGNYNFEGGDRPELMGDQMVWWVMNDRGNEHWWSEWWGHMLPIGMEVRVTAFAFDKRAYRNALDPMLQHTTFYRYRLKYMGDAPLEEAYIGFWGNGGLGNRNKNYVGSDPALHLAYVYSSEETWTTRAKYDDTPPPALGTTILQGPGVAPDRKDNDRDGIIDEPGERLGLSAFVNHAKGTLHADGSPSTGAEAYGYMKGLWLDGQHVTYGGSGRGFSERKVKFMYTGNPPEFWSEENTDGSGSRHWAGYKYYVMSSGPFRMMPGEEQEILVAIVWARGRDRLDSVYKLKREVHALHQAVANGLLTPNVAPRTPGQPTPDRYLLYHNYPNPFATHTTIQYDLPQDRPVHLVVYDVLGRPVRTLVDGHQRAGSYTVEFEAGSLPAGLYLARLRLGHLERTLPMVRLPRDL